MFPLLFYRYMATSCLITELQYNYRIGISTLSYIISQVCQIVLKKLKNVVISKPNSQKWIKISTEFKSHAKLPNCIKELDEKHIRMIQPLHSDSIYYNYNNIFSLVLTPTIALYGSISKVMVQTMIQVFI